MTAKNTPRTYGEACAQALAATSGQAPSAGAEGREVMIFAFECQFADFSPSVVNALTAGKARYEYLLDVREAYENATFADIRVRKIGQAHTSAAFQRTARYRGMPDLKCGDEVSVSGRRGFIVGHNDSANFDVAFVDGEWSGCVLNCHPSDIALAATSVPSRKLAGGE